MPRLGRLAIFLLILLVPARAQDPFADDKYVGRWVTYYYVQKDTAHIGKYLHWLATTSVLDQHPASEPAAAFLATVFAANPDKVRGWVKAEPFAGKAKDVVEHALWMSGRADLIPAVFQEVPDYMNRKPVPLLELPLKTPAAFDMMWAAFFASGDTAYPARLIDVLDENAAITGDRQLDAVYRASADWSLSSNMRQHELIYRMAAREAERRTGALAENLKAKLAALRHQRASLPNCDGEFCAIMALISEANLREFEKPWDQGIQLRELSTAKVGDRVAVKICFSQMALTDDLRADVTFDIKVIRPDGSTYGGSDGKDIRAMQRRTPLRTMIFDNAGVLMIRFEPQDPRGTYTVEVLLKDNVGGKKIKLSKQITLTD